MNRKIENQDVMKLSDKEILNLTCETCHHYLKCENRLKSKKPYYQIGKIIKEACEDFHKELSYDI